MTKSSTTSAQPLHDSASDSDERPSSRAAMPPLPKPASKAVTKRKSGHNLSKFVVNNENSVMSRLVNNQINQS
ncbi:hypothetical protein L13192_04042 [Pyrenophora tritici-repentis]|uniref:Uncharacterized protein n=1 Tax=Pyrenophora tritici-repentis TaxID=45151 RepID=A0A922NDK7_9PLEO|nr:hypothetical protein Ptr86124_005931 [Pyrenophora tritici-repentis]KAI1673183.1 hypothetical protein L13192_04042 [Pyrenophora tritici-repentis]KAI1676987.1 hypothetical protein KJE20_13076 [Pyrenophora tritici-repentis]